MRPEWVVLGVVALGTFMTALDASIVNIGLPSIARTFRTPVGGAAEWVVIAYLVAIAATLLPFGHLSDLMGRKPVWLAGLATFTVGSILCGAAPSLALLVLARAFQGLGGALIFAPALAIITDAFPPAGRGRALGVNAVVFAMGTSLGPTLGGLITEYLSWRWIFYLNVPLGALALLASQAVLPRSGPHRREPFDVAGAGLLAVGFALLTVVLSFSSEWGWGSVRLLACLAVGTVALVGAALVERRAHRPIVDFALFRERMLASSLGSMTLAMLALFAISFMLPFYFEELRGFSVEKSGLLLTPLPLTIAVVAPVSGSLADRMGSRWLAAGGLALACVGLLFLGTARRGEHPRRGHRVSGPHRRRPGHVPDAEFARADERGASGQAGRRLRPARHRARGRPEPQRRAGGGHLRRPRRRLGGPGARRDVGRIRRFCVHRGPAADFPHWVQK